ncbi:jg21565 [Pararge aegeria aegeria]|uniref:Jg21565 protein n=1 Tax=Pararge aegeria aegeria TaxID=348720 RepID=A0A8S4RPW5_9NEOP|nr:jg21565 [Pararge aegeria aegeria]
MLLTQGDLLPPNRWLLGRVAAVYPGSDTVKHAADINTISGILGKGFTGPLLQLIVLRAATDCLTVALPSRNVDAARVLKFVPNKESTIFDLYTKIKIQFKFSISISIHFPLSSLLQHSLSEPK